MSPVGCGRARLSSDVSEIKLAFSIPPHRPPSQHGAHLECGVSEASEQAVALRNFGALIEEVRFARDLYGALPVKRLFLGSAASSLFGAGKAVLRPVACDQVPGARGRGQGTETLAKLGGFAA